MSSSEKSRPAQQQLLPELADLGKPVKLQRGRLQQQQQQGRNCARCGSVFGRFYNTGAACPRCRLRVCRQCRESLSTAASPQNNNLGSNDWLCNVCHRIQDLRCPVQAADSRRGTKREHYLTALNILKYSIRRAWTINGPPGRWSASRKSTEFRLYRSLPVRRRSPLIIDELNTSNTVKRSITHESFIKPPRVVSTSCKTTPQKPSHEQQQQQQQPKKSSIPVFRNRSSREFEDIRGPNETPKRSLIPQRYRGSTDDLRRSREDISIPSFIPKLLSPRNKEDAARANSQQNPQETLPPPTPAGRTRRDTREETAAFAEPKMLDESPSIQQRQRQQERKEVLSNVPVRPSSGEIENDGRPRIEANRDMSLERQVDSKQELSEATMLAKKIDEPPDVEVRKKLSKEELSNDETDEAHRPSSSHLSPEASPLSTRSSKYSPRESESEPTPALPRKTTGDRGESSSASQRIRDAITRTRRESNSSAKYESSGSEGVSRLGDSSLSSYVDIARRVKLYGSCGSLGPSTGSCDEVPQRDSATSAGEDEHEDHSRGSQSSQSRMMLRRRRQFDAQGSRRRGSRSHLARSCCAGPEELPAALQQVVAEEASLLDYRRLVFISSDSSSGREEDDADSSCSGSSYLNNNAVANEQQQTSGIEDCDWDYFESNSLKLPQIRGGPNQANQDWSCCPARPTNTHSSLSSIGCCQACGGSRNAKVLPVPVPIPVPVPYPVPVPASLWTGNESLSPLPLPLSLRGAAVCDPGAAAAAAAASWFSWNPRFDPSSLLLSQAQPHFFTRELSANLREPLRRSNEPEQVQQETNKCQKNSTEPLELTKPPVEDEQKRQEVQEEKGEKEQDEEVEQAAGSAEVEEDQKQEQRMFRHSQEQDSRSSSGRSSADSSDLEDSASHRFSRVLVVNDDSLTSDNDIEDNEDSDSAREGQPIILRRVSVLAEQDQQKEADDSVVLRQIRHIDEDDKLEAEEEKSSEDSSSLEDEQPQHQHHSKNRYCVSDRQEIASYDEIYLASSQDNDDNIVLLKSIKSIDPENTAGRSNSPVRRNFSTVGQYRAFPKQQQQQPDPADPEDESKSLSEIDESSNDSAVMPDSLEVSMQDLEDSIESRDVGGALLAAPSAVEGTLQEGQPLPPPRLQREEGESKCSSSPSSSESSSNAGALSSSDELHEYSLTPPRVSTEQQQQQQGGSSQQLSESSAALMAKSRKKWQIPASFDIKGLPSTHFLPPERKKSTSHSSLLSAAVDAADELQPEDEENANASPAAASIVPASDEALESLEDENDELLPRQPSESMTTARGAHDESSASTERVRGSESTEQVGGSGEDRSWYRAPVERRTPTRKEENNSCVDEKEEEEEGEDEDDDCLPSFPKVRRDWVAPKVGNLSLNHLNNVNNNIAAAGVNNSHLQANNNKYRSLVMITQAAYQPVNVITSDTTTLLQPQPHEQSRYFQQFAAADANQEAVARKNGAQGLSKRPLPCKRLLPEPEVDSGLSVGSASESDDVQSVKNATKQQQANSRSPKFFCSREENPPTAPQPVVEEYSYTSGEARRGGPLILEEGLADDDSWVEEISHDEDEQSATTGTEESSEDESGNNLGGDREEELRGYHRQAIDFTLHTILEESCEESESEQVAASWRRHQLVSASAPDLDKYLFFGLGGSDNGDVDSLSESSSILSEGLDSLSRERASTPQNNASAQEKTSDSPSSRLEKYFLSDFLGGEQDRRDSDGSVGSDSEGRPSPEAQRRKRLVRARGTGRSHSSSLDNLLALAHGSQQNHSSGSHQSLQDVAADGQESQSEASSTETDCAEEIGSNGLPIAADGQFDTVKRKKKKLRSNAQSPRVSEDRNKTPEPEDEPTASRSDEDGVKTPQPELLAEDESTAAAAAEVVDAAAVVAAPVNASGLDSSSSNRPKQQSRDSGFVGSCDDLLLQQPARQQGNVSEVTPKAMEGNSASDTAHTKDHHQNYHYHMERTERLLFSDDRNGEERVEITQREEYSASGSYRFRDRLNKVPDLEVHQPGAGGLSRKDSFNNWSSDEETNLMMSKMRQFFKTMVANSNNNANQQQQQQQQGQTLTAGSAASSTTSSAPSPSPRLSGYPKARAGYNSQSHRTKPPQLVYFENELTRLMKTVPGIRDEQVREIVEYLSSEDTWSDSYDSSDYTSSDLEGATAGGRRSALQEQISQSCQQIINKFDTTTSQQQQHHAAAVSAEDSRTSSLADGKDGTPASSTAQQETQHHYQQQQQGKDTAFVYQKLVQSFTKMAGHENNVANSDASSTTPHSSPPLIAKVMHHIGSRLVALMHEVSESNSSSAGAGYTHGSSGVGWSRRYPHHRTPSSASTTEDDDSTSDSASAPLQLPRSKSHDPLLLINNSQANNVGSSSVLTSMPPEAEEREASDYERFSWRGSFESALMAADSRTKLSLLACSGGDVSASAMAAKRRSAGDLLFNPKSFSREQLDRVRSCGSIGGGTIGASGNTVLAGGSIEEKIWSNRRRSSVPDAHNRGESGASAGDEDTEDEEDDDLEYNGHPGDSRATTLPRGMQMATAAAATNSLPRQSGSSANMHKAHSVYHFLPQQSAGVKSARYRPPGFNRNSSSTAASLPQGGPKRAFSAPGLQLQSRSRRHQQGLGHGQAGANASSSANVSGSASISASGSTGDEASSLSEACSTPIIGASSRHVTSSHHASMDLMDDIDRGMHSTHLTRASLSSLGARSDSMASVYSGAGEGRWCGSVAVRGEVEFSLQYDYKQLTFEVHVTQCRDLAPVDVKRNRSDPYVKVYLLPDKSKSGKRKTKVKKHTLNPVFDETLKFHTSLNSLESRTLWLTVWHSDMFGRNDFLGEVRMPLENKIFDDPRPQWYPLQERTEPFDDPIAYKGEVIVGLKFVPPDPARQDRDRGDSATNKLKKSWSRGALHVLVKEARNLQTRAKNSGTCDPFCKSYLLPDKGRSSKQKTAVVRRSTGSPVWNHTFVYKDVSLQELADRGLELTVWDHDRIASNEFLGGVRFNLGTGKHYGKAVDWMDATGREMSLWQNMLERPNFWVEGAVTLRPNLHNHVKSGAS
ncbi:uncharacterized protein LOC100123872 isoform X2 [Nasonia vitripennis]|uniref:C2 domain-containing protein n=1 Tax=Nasonia vitripennis TaxID=7425 RepID=A0A7M7PZN6_NASVI|nr:uncharacterized protein LOC100123872 isoform X2 [Nasonia vitripennis]